MRELVDRVPLIPRMTLSADVPGIQGKDGTRSPRRIRNRREIQFASQTREPELRGSRGSTTGDLDGDWSARERRHRQEERSWEEDLHCEYHDFLYRLASPSS